MVERGRSAQSSISLLPQFTDPTSTWPIAAQIVLLGLIHTAICAVVSSGVGAMPRVSGVVAMIVVGALLLVDQLVR